MQRDQSTARGRHAPPPEVRLPRAARAPAAGSRREFAEHGYAGASSESISRRAAMSKATFYEHFANKEECILALFDEPRRRSSTGDVGGRSLRRRPMTPCSGCASRSAAFLHDPSPTIRS